MSTGGFLEVGLVMERLEGDLAVDVSSRAVLHKPYTEAELRHILECMSEALLYAKLRVRTSKGVAHRDIKPGNIFLDKGQYKLGDFGSAYAANKAVINKADGTLEYSSPEMYERILGREVEVDYFQGNQSYLFYSSGIIYYYFQSDVYSLGVTLLHLAKLELPTSICQAGYNTQLKQKRAG